MSRTVAIIGNGFDLNLGMKTSYLDFLGSGHFPQSSDPDSLPNYLAKQAQLQRWIDVEVELAKYAKSMARKERFRHEYNILRESLIDYILSLPTPTIQEDSHAVRFMKEVINAELTDVISFNYTNTAHQLLADLGMPPEEINKRVTVIHGTCTSRNIIFGVEDSATVPDEHVFLHKSSAVNFAGRALINKLETATDIYIFGHSLGPTDHMYFTNTFNTLCNAYWPNKKLIVYYYSPSGLDETILQLRKITGNRVAQLKSNTFVELRDAAETI